LSRATDTKPAPFESAGWITRTALCAEVRNGCLYLFMPPMSALEDYLELVAAIEATAESMQMPVVLEGYEPPRDPRLRFAQPSPQARREVDPRDRHRIDRRARHARLDDFTYAVRWEPVTLTSRPAERALVAIGDPDLGAALVASARAAGRSASLEPEGADLAAIPAGADVVFLADPHAAPEEPAAQHLAAVALHHAQRPAIDGIDERQLDHDAAVGVEQRRAVDEVAALAFGRNPYTLRLRAYVIGGMVGAFGGALLVNYVQAFSPQAWSPLETFLLYGGLLVGGTGNNLGAVVGSSLVLIAFPQLVLNLPPSWVPNPDALPAIENMIVGLLIILTLYFRPGGLIPELPSMSGQFRTRGRWNWRVTSAVTTSVAVDV
jgi:hypothetical protein